MDISGNQLMLPCYLFVHECNVKKIYDQLCVWRPPVRLWYLQNEEFILKAGPVPPSHFSKTENWLGGYKR